MCPDSAVPHNPAPRSPPQLGGKFSSDWTSYTAIRDGLARTRCAWATLAEVRKRGGAHLGAMGDLVAAVNTLKVGEDVGRGRHAGRGAGPAAVQAHGRRVGDGGSGCAGG
jgi:hypothetical protein